ncbi:ComF family protein [Chitinophaga dinghuensis]|uniref:ComF family protein n=1 Tax=Chitinophaga dinghuensis TaxID=1539050 RepID=A0A327W519_9BACT|nr:ComF family protein [Chitinophaga dinghuensis]RAJ85609.1 ComF family protein [Chitinophaga dinghuensis]
MISRLLTPLVDLFYPHCCDICGTDLSERQEKLCISCMTNLPETQFHLMDNNPVEKIFWGRCVVQHATAAYYYSPSSGIQRLVHSFKYKQRPDLATYLGKKVGAMLLQSTWIHEIDAVVPVPMHARKQRKRGYNQAALLAEGIAAVIQKPVLNNFLQKCVTTNTQTRKDRTERWGNVANVFQAADAAKGKHFLLIDDVITTGATTEACCQAIQQTGADVSVCCLAYAWS